MTWSTWTVARFMVNSSGCRAFRRVTWMRTEVPGLPRISDGQLLFLLHMIPKMLQLGESFGMSAAHDEILQTVERRLNQVEPRPKKRARRLGAKMTTAPVRARGGRSPGRRGAGPNGSDR